MDSTARITAIVPSGAGTGRVSVTVRGRRAASPADFVVDHERTVTLKFVEDRVHGAVTVVDGFTRCGAGIPIELQRLSGGRWRTLARSRTDADGSFLFGNMDRAGSYRAIAKKTIVPPGDVALKAVSAVVTRNLPAGRLTRLLSAVD